MTSHCGISVVRVPASTSPFPSFHLVGFYNKIMVPLYTNTIPVFGPPQRPSSGRLMTEIMRHQDIRGAVLPPSIAEETLCEQDGIEKFRKLEVLCFAGGPLSPGAGDEISKVTLLCQFYGSTELGQIRQLVPRPGTWSYMEFDPFAKLEFQRVDDDVFELAVFADASTEFSSSLNHNYPDVKEWRTKDLFKPHPTVPNLWKFHGRSDDIIVLSNGEKFNPVPMEKALQSHPEVTGALVTGQGRFQAALLIESKAECKDLRALKDEIWPIVETENQKLPGPGRISESMILVVEVDRRFIRAGKGTIVRKMTEDLYAVEIHALYANTLKRHPGTSMTLKASEFRLDDIRKPVRSILEQCLPKEKLEDEDNLYSSGLDSLRTVEAVDKLKANLLSHRQLSELSWFTADTVYQNPTIKQLSEALRAFLNNGEIPEERRRTAEMSALFEKFAKTLPKIGYNAPRRLRADGVVVALTGSTGSLGTHLLAELLETPAISRIYCLNRSANAQQQWQDMGNGWNIYDTSIRAKVTFIATDCSQDKFGLQEVEYSELTSQCDLMVHAAWKVDFKQSLHSFTENIRSAHDVVKWSAASPRRPMIVFVSSISSVCPWGPKVQEGSLIPEGPVAEFDTALNVGYGESKQVTERPLDRAATQCQVPVTILRVGQISGAASPSNRAWAAPWSERELIPSILKTSRSLGMIPVDLPFVDWIPIDILSQIIVELSLHDIQAPGDSTKYYNLVNPIPVPWVELLEPLKESCGPQVQVVTLSEWVQKLKSLDRADTEELKSRPALKTLDFFTLMISRGPVARYATAASIQASGSMAVLKPVDQILMRTYLKQSI